VASVVGVRLCLVLPSIPLRAGWTRRADCSLIAAVLTSTLRSTCEAAAFLRAVRERCALCSRVAAAHLVPMPVASGMIDGTASVALGEWAAFSCTGRASATIIASTEATFSSTVAASTTVVACVGSAASFTVASTVASTVATSTSGSTSLAR